MATKLTLAIFKQEATAFAKRESLHREKELFGVTDSKALGIYLEHKFQASLRERYEFPQGNSAGGIVFPHLDIDLKVTSIVQPQSFCPFDSARQKIYGLGYSLLIFVYNKKDNVRSKTGLLDIKHVIFVENERTGDYQTTSGLLKLLRNGANKDDVLAFFAERMLPIDDIQAGLLAEEVLQQPPAPGYLTLSVALQWRLQYSRFIEQAGSVDGILRLA